MKKEIVEIMESLDKRKLEILYYFILGLTSET